VRGLPTYATSPSVLGRAVVAGFAVAIPVGLLWGFGPAWQFYLALALGFGVAEAMATASNQKRGRDLQFLAIAIIAVGVVIGRVVLAQRLGISLAQVNELNPAVERQLYLRLVPDLLIVVLPMVLGWIRFR